jgi:hypothetical protein
VPLKPQAPCNRGAQRLHACNIVQQGLQGLKQPLRRLRRLWKCVMQGLREMVQGAGLAWACHGQGLGHSCDKSAPVAECVTKRGG